MPTCVLLLSVRAGDMQRAGAGLLGPGAGAMERRMHASEADLLVAFLHLLQ